MLQEYAVQRPVKSVLLRAIDRCHPALTKYFVNCVHFIASNNSEIWPTWGQKRRKKRDSFGSPQECCSLLRTRTGTDQSLSVYSIEATRGPVLACAIISWSTPGRVNGYNGLTSLSWTVRDKRHFATETTTKYRSLIILHHGGRGDSRAQTPMGAESSSRYVYTCICRIFRLFKGTSWKRTMLRYTEQGREEGEQCASSKTYW